METLINWIGSVQSGLSTGFYLMVLYLLIDVFRYSTDGFVMGFVAAFMMYFSIDSYCRWKDSFKKV